MGQRPCCEVPSRAAKQASERGQYSQSIEPSRPTRAAVLKIEALEVGGMPGR